MQEQIVAAIAHDYPPRRPRDQHRAQCVTITRGNQIDRLAARAVLYGFKQRLRFGGLRVPTATTIHGPRPSKAAANAVRNRSSTLRGTYRGSAPPAGSTGPPCPHQSAWRRRQRPRLPGPTDAHPARPARVLPSDAQAAPDTTRFARKQRRGDESHDRQPCRHQAQLRWQRPGEARAGDKGKSRQIDADSAARALRSLRSCSS